VERLDDIRPRSRKRLLEQPAVVEVISDVGRYVAAGLATA
jgi:hypothetical protein